jgi:predicted ATPase
MKDNLLLYLVIFCIFVPHKKHYSLFQTKKLFMRITNVSIPPDDSNNGLAHIKMDKIDHIVLIAGKNGSGKSRLLKTVKDALAFKPTTHSLKKNKEDSISYKNQITIYEEVLSSTEHNIRTQPNSPQFGTWEVDVARYTLQLAQEKIRYASCIKHLNWNLVKADKLYDEYVSVDFVPTSLDLGNRKKLNIYDIEINAQGVSTMGTFNLAKGTLSYIQVLQTKWYESTHQHSTASNLEKIEATNNYDKLVYLIKLFLNTELTRKDGDATIFGLELSSAQLSSGQKILLQLCVAIHAQNATLNDVIIFMDEPENHLHPSAVIEIIKKIEENVPNGQIWIATHSIPLLSHFDPKYLWFMDNNTIKYSGRTPETVLNSLLGDEEQRAKLHNFMSLPAIYAFNRFAHECLFDPAVLMTSSKDPQISQIREMLHKIPVNPIKILDFGAGKGRMLANVSESLGVDKTKFVEKYNYIAFDEYDADKADCESFIQSIYEDSKDKYFNSIDKLFTRHDKGSFHVVVMCNVLHEIPVEKWRDYFGERGQISQCLSDEGFLLLVEDTEMPVGEKAHQKGFLVIDTVEIKELFKITVEDTTFTIDDFENKGRLKAHLIPKSCLTRMTNETLKEAVLNLRQRAGREISAIRKKDQSFRNGLKHGYWVQIYANAQLALDEVL